MSITTTPNEFPTAPTFEDALVQLEKMYPGKRVLVEIPGPRYGHVINYLKAPVKGYHNPKKDLMEIELMAKIGEGKDVKFAPYSPAQIIRTHTGILKIIGAV